MRIIPVVAATLSLLAIPAQASVQLTEHQARTAARLGLEASLGGLVYRSAGSAPVRMSRCHVRGRRATCYGVVKGTITCRARMRVLLAGSLPASDPDARLLVWADQLRCA